jgi:RNA polymerase sigma-70 factor, ECF subfamily
VELMTDPAEPDLEQLYLGHSPAVLRYVVRRIDDTDAALDLVAEVFLVAWRRRTELPWDRPLPWLYGVARLELAMRRRTARRAAAAAIRVGNDLVVQGEVQLAEQVEWATELGDALAALRELSEADQEVLRLAAWEELRGKDLAVALGCSPAAAAVRLHRARHRLRGVLRSKGIPVGGAAGSTVISTTHSGTQGEHS